MKLAIIEKPRTLAHVLLDLTEARRDYEAAMDAARRAPIGSREEDDAGDRASEADKRMDELRDEFEATFNAVTGLTWAQIQNAIQEAVL